MQDSAENNLNKLTDSRFLPEREMVKLYQASKRDCQSMLRAVTQRKKNVACNTFNGCLETNSTSFSGVHSRVVQVLKRYDVGNIFHEFHKRK